MKSDKGITLIALIIMIIIISILAGVVINSAMGAYEEAKLTRFVARMNMIQSKVNIAYTDIKNGNKAINDYGLAIGELNDGTIEKIKSIIPEANFENYRYLSKSQITKELELQNISEEIVVNFETREIYNLRGIEYEGVIFYNQYNLPNGQYNIDFQNKNSEAPDYSLSKRNYGLYSYIDVENIVYKDNVNGGKIYYGLITGENNGDIIVDYWKETEEEIYVDVSGEYAVKIIDKAGNETVKKVNIVLENAPKLSEDMTAVVYDENKKQWKKVSQADEGKWYDYAENKWANIMMNDGIQIDSNGYITSYGSMFVWIPRYAYNIKNGFHTSTAGDIEIKFLKGTTSLTTDKTNITYSNTSGNDKWLIHPAFKNGQQNKYSNGEWREDIEGIWIAKFETSMETNGKHTETSSESTGNLLTNDSIKSVSKPGVSSWRYINIGNAYKNGLSYNKNANSHMIKNSEWGAVAYLTQSKYGRNKQEVTINNSSSYITGNAGNTVDASATTGITNAYDTEKGVLASTTGNIYGVYDMSGGACEYVSGYITSGCDELSVGSSFVALEIGNNENFQARCIPYATAYPQGNSANNLSGIETSYDNWNNVYGDAIYETSQREQQKSWNGELAEFDDMSYSEPFLYRGGEYLRGKSAGIFYFSDGSGTSESDLTYRLSMIVEDEEVIDEIGEIDASIPDGIPDIYQYVLSFELINGDESKINNFAVTSLDNNNYYKENEGVYLGIEVIKMIMDKLINSANKGYEFLGFVEHTLYENFSSDTLIKVDYTAILIKPEGPE